MKCILAIIISIVISKIICYHMHERNYNMINIKKIIKKINLKRK